MVSFRTAPMPPNGSTNNGGHIPATPPKRYHGTLLYHGIVCLVLAHCQIIQGTILMYVHALPRPAPEAGMAEGITRSLPEPHTI
jgi:hypothetical protein